MTGVVVTNVEPGSLAARAMIRPEDVIISVGGQSVDTVAKFRDVMAEQDPNAGIRMQVLRGGFKRYVFIRGN